MGTVPRTAWFERMAWRRPPPSRAEAEAAVVAAYQAAGLDRPAIVWAEGPSEAWQIVARTVWVARAGVTALTMPALAGAFWLTGGLAWALGAAAFATSGAAGMVGLSRLGRLSRGLPWRTGPPVGARIDAVSPVFGARLGRDPELARRCSQFARVHAGVSPPGPAVPRCFLQVADRIESAADDPLTRLVMTVDAVWTFRHVAVIMAPPQEVLVNEAGRLNGQFGPAIRWADGAMLFASDGQLSRSGASIILPDELTLERVRLEPDRNIRRAMLTSYGPERVMRSLGRRMGEDRTGELWRAEDFDGEPLVMVRVVNSTPEPDGSNRIYWLRVPPGTATPLEGVAWTFGLTTQDYAPLLET